jgi:hypothetical protein
VFASSFLGALVSSLLEPIFTCLLIISELRCLYYSFMNESVKSHTIKVKSIADPCAGRSGVAQIQLCQKMHDHISCIYKETLVFPGQTSPCLLLPMSCMNRHSIWYKEQASITLALFLTEEDLKWKDNDTDKGHMTAHRIEVKKDATATVSYNVTIYLKANEWETAVIMS